MKSKLRTILSIAIVCLYAFAFVGCNNSPSSTTSTPSVSGEDNHDHDGDDHDHEGDDHDHEGHDHDDHDHEGDDHEGHDHPAHGPNGGHMINLSGGAHAEWAHDDDTDTITVYAEKPDAVTKVEMKTTIEENETVYEFEKKEADGKTVYEIVNPELLTAVKMGKAVDTKLVISTEDDESTGQIEHHSH